MPLPKTEVEKLVLEAVDSVKYGEVVFIKKDGKIVGIKYRPDEDRRKIETAYELDNIKSQKY